MQNCITVNKKDCEMASQKQEWVQRVLERDYENVHPNFFDVNKIRIDANKMDVRHFLLAGKGVTKRCRQDEEHAMIGWTRGFVEMNTQVLSMSRWRRDYPLKNCDSMPSWMHMKDFAGTTEFHADTLNEFFFVTGCSNRCARPT